MEFKKVPMDLAVALLQYLQTKPLGEVNDLFHALNQLPIEDDEVPAEEP